MIKNLAGAYQADSGEIVYNRFVRRLVGQTCGARGRFTDGWASRAILDLYALRFGPVPVLVIGFAILLVVIAVLLRRSPFGRYIYAVGGNEQVAHLSGLPVNRVKSSVGMLCSVLAAVTGLLYVSRKGIGDPVVGDSLKLQTITAVTLDGTSRLDFNISS